MKVIYFKTSNSTFVLKDQEILVKNFSTKVYYINNSSPLVYCLSLVKLIGFLVFVSWKADVFFIRFTDWHTAILAFFKKLYNKKLYIVIGGYDVAAIPQISYGLHLRKGRSLFAKYAMNNASCLLPVSSSLIYYENNFVAKEPVVGGITYFVPRIKSRIQVINNGFDGNLWYKKPGIEKKNIVLTVAQVGNSKTFYLKGIDMFIRMAERFSEYQFVTIGVPAELINQNQILIPKNFTPLPKAGYEELLESYSTAKVFCLFSLSEGMPNVLCEAMLCECIPVGTNVTSIPEIIGDTGFVVKENIIKHYEQAIRNAIGANIEKGKAARERILAEYSLKRRVESLVDIINGK